MLTLAIFRPHYISRAKNSALNATMSWCSGLFASWKTTTVEGGTSELPRKLWRSGTLLSLVTTINRLSSTNTSGRLTRMTLTTWSTESEAPNICCCNPTKWTKPLNLKTYSLLRKCGSPPLLPPQSLLSSSSSSLSAAKDFQQLFTNQKSTLRQSKNALIHSVAARNGNQFFARVK